MKPEIKELWLAALLSGKYQQGEGWLRESDNFCCLGVLCDLAVGEGVVKTKGSDMKGIHSYCGSDASVSILPRDVMHWAGLKDNNPYVRVFEDQRRDGLAGINDSGVSFEEIAYLIDRDL